MADKGERKKRSKNKTVDVTKLRDNSATPKSKRRFKPVVVFEDEGVDDFVEHISSAKISKKEAPKKTKIAAKPRQENDPSSSNILKPESTKKQSKSLIPVESKPELVTEEASSSRIAKIEIERTKSSTPKFQLNSNPKCKNVSQFGAEKLRFPISSSPIVQLVSAESALGRRRSALSSNTTLPLGNIPKLR